MEAFKRPLFDDLDHVKIGRIAEILETRANSLCLTFRTSEPAERRRETGERVRMLRQRAGVLRRWQTLALEGRPLPLNWKAEIAEAENLVE
jgi:hypothetical protein